MSHMFTLYELHKLQVLQPKLKILQYTGLYIEIVEAKILFGQKMWGIDSWFSYRGVESWDAIYPSYSNPEGRAFHAMLTEL